jgi:hypothetical protein
MTLHFGFVGDMWEWFSKYPSVRIEDAGTPYVKGLESENVVEYDYIIVGGGFSLPSLKFVSGLTF